MRTAAFALTLAADANAEAAQALREFLTSWPVQAALAALYLGLAVLVFARVARAWDDGPARRYVRGAVAALGVFVVLEVVLGQALLGVFIWPTWLVIVELLWLFALWLYYFIRFMTRQRSGRGDAEARRRGAALDGSLSRLDQERRTGGPEGDAGAPLGRPPASR